jgi:hypothetical protein
MPTLNFFNLLPRRIGNHCQTRRKGRKNIWIRFFFFVLEIWSYPYLSRKHFSSWAFKSGAFCTCSKSCTVGTCIDQCSYLSSFLSLCCICNTPEAGSKMLLLNLTIAICGLLTKADIRKCYRPDLKCFSKKHIHIYNIQQHKNVVTRLYR